jgi:hypothetical protein
MRISSAGDVSIGTTSGGAGLYVVPRASVPYSIFDTASAGFGYSAFSYNGTNYGFIGQATGLLGTGTNTDLAIRADANMLFGIGSTERMRVTSTGNVGIGETAPGSALQVNGNIRVSNGTGFTTGNSLIRSIQSMSGSTNQFVSNSIDFYTAAFTDNGQIAFSTGTTERMRIDGSGNVGIGTSSPIGKMEVVQNSGTGNVITVRNTNSNQFFIGGLSMLNAATANNFGVTIGTGVRDVDGTDSFFTINKVTSGTSYVSELAYYDLSAEFWKFSTNFLPKRSGYSRR